MTTLAISHMRPVPMTNQDRKLGNVHFFHLKHVQKFFLSLIRNFTYLCDVRLTIRDITSDPGTMKKNAGSYLPRPQSHCDLSDLRSSGRWEDSLYHLLFNAYAFHQIRPVSTCYEVEKPLPMKIFFFYHTSTYFVLFPCANTAVQLLMCSEQPHSPGQTCRRTIQRHWKSGPIKPALTLSSARLLLEPFLP